MDYFDGRFVYGDIIYVDEAYFDEKWKYINDFPDYMVSDKGRVWSTKTNRFIKVKPMDKHGHLGVCLLKNGVHYYKYIHRLVAEAFIPNPENLPIVRHVYDEPSLNSVEDLAWGTKRDNFMDSVKNGTAYFLTDEDREKGNRDRCMSIVATHLTSNKKLYFKSQGEAARVLRVPQANIFKVIRKQRSMAGGYVFEEVRHE